MRRLAVIWRFLGRSRGSLLTLLSRLPLPVVAATASALAIIDPFGSDSATDRASQDVVLRALAPFYPERVSADLADTSPGDRPPVTVVLVDREFLEGIGGGRYPLAYRRLHELVRRVICTGPSVVFVDMVFLYMHDDPGALEELAAYLGGADDGDGEAGCGPRPPVYVGDLLPEDGGEPASLDPIRRQVARLPVGWSLPAGEYPLWAWAAPASGSALPWSTEERCRVPFPALRLYLDHLSYLDRYVATARSAATDGAGRRYSDRDPVVGLWEGGPRCDRSVDPDTMVLGWPLRPRSAPAGLDRRRYHDIAESPCSDAGGGGPLPRAARMVKSLLSDVSSVLGAPRPVQPCLPSYFLPAGALFEAGADPSLDGPLRDQLKGRVVLIGIDLTLSGDAALSPVHGQVPGVFMHAMALDNLFVWQDRYWRNGAPLRLTSLGISVDRNNLLAAILVWPLTIVYWLQGKLWPKWGGAADHLAFLICSGTVAYLATVFFWAPFNWVGFLFFFIAIREWGSANEDGESPKRPLAVTQA